jgi:integrase
MARRDACSTQFRQAVDQAAAQRPAALLILAFSTAARASDVLELTKSDISIDGTKLMIQFQRGKGVKFRGPSTVHGALSDHLRAAETRWAWHAPTPQQRVALTADLLTLIRTAGGASLRQSSIRRGALQRMATLGASEEDFMHFERF